MRIDMQIAGSHFRGPPAEKKVRSAMNGALPVRLEPQDDNPHDEHAVKVLIDEMHVGYIPRDMAPTVRNWIAAGRVGELRIVRPWNVQVEVGA